MEAEAFERAQVLKTAITQLKLDAEKLKEAEEQQEENKGAHPYLWYISPCYRVLMCGRIDQL